MRPLTILAAIAATAMLPGVAWGITCYTVLDRSDNTIYQDTEPPIDLSEAGAAARDAMRARGEYLTISEADRCLVVSAPPGATGYKPASVDEIVAGIRDYARVMPGDAPASSRSTTGTRGTTAAAPARSGSTGGRKY